MSKPDLVTYPACKAGKYTLKVTTHGKPGEEAIELDCPTCAGTGKVTLYPAHTASSGPVGITVGPDCTSIWFTESSADRLGRVAPFPTPPAASLAHP